MIVSFAVIDMHVFIILSVRMRKTYYCRKVNMDGIQKWGRTSSSSGREIHTTCRAGVSIGRLARGAA